MSEDAEREAEAVALAHQMGYADGAAAARATVERLEARVAELEAALRELWHWLVGAGYSDSRLDRAAAALKGGDADGRED